MSLLITVVPYAAAYMFLSVCVGLVVGRMLRTMNPSDELPDEMWENRVEAPTCTLTAAHQA